MCGGNRCERLTDWPYASFGISVFWCSDLEHAETSTEVHGADVRLQTMQARTLLYVHVQTWTEN